MPTTIKKYVEFMNRIIIFKDEIKYLKNKNI